MFLDALRHSVDIIHFTYERLTAILTGIAQNAAHPLNDVALTAAFSDAWTIVDSVYRFRALWRKMPNPIPEPLEVGDKTFDEITESIAFLRNVADHLDKKIPQDLIAQQATALGELSWYTHFDPATPNGLICLLIPGTVDAGARNVVNPIGQEIQIPTSCVQLKLGKHKTSLSDVIPELDKRVHKLEMELEQRIAAMPEAVGKQAGTDVALFFAIELAGPLEPKIGG